MKTQLELAQDALDSRLKIYYEASPDGGCTDEIFKIAFCVSKQYEVSIDDLIF